MARVIFLQLDQGNASHLKQLLSGDHEILCERYDAPIGRIGSATVVFLGGLAESYLPLLRRLRAADSQLPLIVVARSPDTQEWLAALESGTTDYLLAPFDSAVVRSLMEHIPVAAGVSR